MAFTTAQAKIDAVAKAGNTLGTIRTVYAFGVQLQTMLATYQAGTDPALNAAFNALYTTAERTELATMIGELNTLVTNWQANHLEAVTL